jgi:adenylate cyclase
MEQQSERNPRDDELWAMYVKTGVPYEEQKRHFFRFLPSNPRCKKCYAPFNGVGGAIMRTVLNIRPSPHNPLLCNTCEEFAKRHPGGVETEMSMLFADVRGSTPLAEKMNPAEFSGLINRFYNVSIKVLAEFDAMIDRLVGDEMIGYFLPYMTGPNHAKVAIQAAQALLKATGHNDPGGPWIPVGIGVHTGVAYFGTVGSKHGMMDITVLGNNPNLTSRLASAAGQGEILISQAAYEAAGLDLGRLEQRTHTLKGVTEPVTVKVFMASSHP